MSNGKQWVKTVDQRGAVITSPHEEEALVLMNHHWSELITRNHLAAFKPHLIDVELVKGKGSP